jgi:very-short-patch-repair endonuclease
MDAVSALTRLGGIGSTADLLELTTRKRLRRAVVDRTIVHVSRGRYALPSADLARSLAAEVDGHLRLLSAVAHWGWESKWPARHPQLGIAHRPDRPVEAEVFVGAVPRRDIDGWATSKVRTVLDCAAELPFDEALAVADSALRHGDVTRDELEVAMGDDPRVHRVVAHATELAANPFESVLRAILVEAGIGVVPQWETTIGRVTYHPDLAEPFAGLAIEANSWRHHAGKAEHDADCRRYNALVVGGWTVLRFTWEQVMFSPWEVVATVRGVLALGATSAA